MLNAAASMMARSTRRCAAIYLCAPESSAFASRHAPGLVATLRADAAERILRACMAEAVNELVDLARNVADKSVRTQAACALMLHLDRGLLGTS